jgi:hypothetical protein
MLLLRDPDNEVLNKRLAVRMFIAQRLPKFLCKCDFEWVVKQRLDGFNEAYGMRQLRVPFKRRHVSPPSMNVELVRISNGAKSAIAEAAWFVARGSLNFKHCLVHLALLTIASVESGEDKYPHDRFRGRRQSGGKTTILPYAPGPQTTPHGFSTAAHRDDAQHRSSEPNVRHERQPQAGSACRRMSARWNRRDFPYSKRLNRTASKCQD